MTPDDSPAAELAALRAAYRGLAEDQKSAMLRHLEKAARATFDELVARAGLDRGGFRPKAIAERRDPRVRARIDEAFTREGNEDLLELAAWHFFRDVRPDFAEALNAVDAEESEAAGEPPEVDALLSLTERRAGAKKGWEFFRAAVRADPESYLEPAEPEESEDEPQAEGAFWARGFDMVEKACADLRRLADELAALTETDFEELSDAVEIAFNVSSSLRKEIDNAARESAFDSPIPADPAGLREYAAALAAHRAARKLGAVSQADEPGVEP